MRRRLAIIFCAKAARPQLSQCMKVSKTGNKVRFETNGKAVFADRAAKNTQDQQVTFFITQNDIETIYAAADG